MQTRKHLYILSGLFVSLFTTYSNGADLKGWLLGVTASNYISQWELPTLKYIGKSNSINPAINRYHGAYISDGPAYLPINSNFWLKNNLITPASIIQLTGTASMPITAKLGLFGKLGLSRVNDAQPGCRQSLWTCSFSDHANDVSYGIGLRYDFTKSISLQGEWERLKQFNGGNAITSDYDRALFSIGVGFKF